MLMSLPGSPECVKLAVRCNALARDLSRIIDRFSRQQMQRRVRDQGVEVHRHFALPYQSQEVPRGGVYRKANHLAAVVDRVTAGRDGYNGPGKRTKVLH